MYSIFVNSLTGIIFLCATVETKLLRVLAMILWVLLVLVRFTRFSWVFRKDFSSGSKSFNTLQGKLKMSLMKNIISLSAFLHIFLHILNQLFIISIRLENGGASSAMRTESTSRSSTSTTSCTQARARRMCSCSCDTHLNNVAQYEQLNSSV